MHPEYCRNDDARGRFLREGYAANKVGHPGVVKVQEDGSTPDALSEENLVASDLRYPDRTGETYAVTYNPAQRWYYFPKMQADEAVLIRCFDSARSGAARFSAHGAFEDPGPRPTPRRARASRCAPWCSSPTDGPSRR